MLLDCGDRLGNISFTFVIELQSSIKRRERVDFGWRECGFFVNSRVSLNMHSISAIFTRNSLDIFICGTFRLKFLVENNKFLASHNGSHIKLILPLGEAVHFSFSGET